MLGTFESKHSSNVGYFRITLTRTSIKHRSSVGHFRITLTRTSTKRSSSVGHFRITLTRTSTKRSSSVGHFRISLVPQQNAVPVSVTSESHLLVPQQNSTRLMEMQMSPTYCNVFEKSMSNMWTQAGRPGFVPVRWTRSPPHPHRLWGPTTCTSN
jgi:hypothetical protein